MSPFLIEVYESGPWTPSRDHVTGLDIASCNFSRMYCKESVRIYLCTGLNVCPLWIYTMNFSGNWVSPDRTQGWERQWVFTYLKKPPPPSKPTQTHTQTWSAASAGAPLSCPAKFLEDNETPLWLALVLWWTTSGSNHVNLHHPLTFSLTLHTLSVWGVVCVGFLSAPVCICVCARGIKYLSLTFSLAVHMVL